MDPLPHYPIPLSLSPSPVLNAIPHQELRSLKQLGWVEWEGARSTPAACYPGPTLDSSLPRPSTRGVPFARSVLGSLLSLTYQVED